MPSPRNPSQRIRGQEVNLLFTQDGELLDTLTDIKNFQFDAKLEIKEEGYLGEKTNRHDYIYSGVKGSFEMHLHRAKWLEIQQAVISTAKRETPDVVFNITAVLAFADGTTPTVTFPDVNWGPQSTNISARTEYVSVKCEFACDDFVSQQG